MLMLCILIYTVAVFLTIKKTRFRAGKFIKFVCFDNQNTLNSRINQLNILTQPDYDYLKTSYVKPI